MLMKRTTKFVGGQGGGGRGCYLCKTNELLLEVWAGLTCWRERFSAVAPFVIAMDKRGAASIALELPLLAGLIRSDSGPLEDGKVPNYPQAVTSDSELSCSHSMADTNTHTCISMTCSELSVLVHFLVILIFGVVSQFVDIVKISTH